MGNLTVEQEQAFVTRIKAGDGAAREAFAAHYMNLARNLAHRYDASGVPYEDREAAAYLGLSYALDHIARAGERNADTFDPDESRFSTYAARWMKEYVRKTITAHYAHSCEVSASSVCIGCIGVADDSWLDTIAVDDAVSPHDAASFAEQAAHMLAAMKERLTAREADVLERRYGLNGYHGQPSTLRAIGDALGVSHERVRQIESGALDKLRMELAV